MATLLIRRLDDDLKLRLRERATSHGRSMEEEARTILRETLGPKTPVNHGQHLLDVIEDTFGRLGGIELELPSRKSSRDIPTFD